MPAGPVPDIRGLDLGGVRQDERAASPTPDDGVGLRKSDFDDFERALKDTQDAFSRADLAALGRLCTPEMLAYLSEQLTDDASAGLSNRVEHVSLEQGDLAEAWREGGRDYATVAMRWRALDYTVEVESGRIVSGNADTPAEATELWTFLRGPSGRWLVSAIQQG
jgi:predicted lipid-binding transport protein (Tim44 family)